MDEDLEHIHLRVSPKAKARAVKAAQRLGIPLTAFGEAIFTLKSDELGRDPDIIAHGQKIEAYRRDRKRG